MERIRALCLTIVLTCIAIIVWAQEEAGNRTVAEKLITQVDFTSWIPKSLKISPDGKRLVYGARVRDKRFAVVDGEEGRQYDSILRGTPVFRPDSKQIAYAAQLGNQWFVVQGKKEEKRYDGIWTIVFTPDSRRIAYVAQTGAEQFAVTDGKEQKQYDSIIVSSIIFDSSNALHYLAAKGSSIYYVEEKRK